MNKAVILSAGKSERLLDISVPKQLYEINNIPLFMYSVLTFDKIDDIDEIYIVTNDFCLEKINEYLNKFKPMKIKGVISGGQTRQESVYNAIKYLEPLTKNDDIILIHDSARPLIGRDIILNNIEGVKKYDAVSTAIKVKDSEFRGEDDYVGPSVDRENLYQAQTPQSFRFGIIKKAHKNALESGFHANEDSALVRKLGYNVHIVPGASSNFKITRIDDIELLKMIIK